MKEVLEHILERLSAIQELNYVSEDWGQLDSFGADCPVKWPCSLIDLQDGIYSDIGSSKQFNPANRQEGGINIGIKVANLRLTNPNSRAPQSHKDNAFKIHEVIEKVHQALHGYHPGGEHGALMRTSFRKISRGDGVQLYLVIYSFGAHNV